MGKIIGSGTFRRKTDQRQKPDHSEKERKGGSDLEDLFDEKNLKRMREEQNAALKKYISFSITYFHYLFLCCLLYSISSYCFSKQNFEQELAQINYNAMQFSTAEYNTFADSPSQITNYLYLGSPV